MTMLPRLLPLPLRDSDRCDRCPATAQLRAVLSAGDLLFCGHHAREYRHRLMAVGAVLIVKDQYEARRPPSSN